MALQALSKHIAHLFSRDPLVIFEGRVEEVDDEEEVCASLAAVPCCRSLPTCFSSDPPLKGLKNVYYSFFVCLCVVGKS